jgi:hypothetical protein
MCEVMVIIGVLLSVIPSFCSFFRSLFQVSRWTLAVVRWLEWGRGTRTRTRGGVLPKIEYQSHR